jgi:hypothetical protein
MHEPEIAHQQDSVAINFCNFSLGFNNPFGKSFLCGTVTTICHKREICMNVHAHVLFHTLGSSILRCRPAPSQEMMKAYNYNIQETWCNPHPYYLLCTAVNIHIYVYKYAPALQSITIIYMSAYEAAIRLVSCIVS